MQETVKQIFEKLLPGPKVIACRVLPKLDGLFTLAKQLREMKRLYRQTRRLNKDSESKQEVDSDGAPKRVTMKKRKGCLISTVKYDAEDYYREKVITLSEKIKEEN